MAIASALATLSLGLAPPGVESIEAAVKTPSVSQLVINERISRAAIVAVERLDAAIEGRVAARVVRRSPPRAIDAQAVRRDRHRAQIALWRGARLTARLAGSADPVRPRLPTRVEVTAEQVQATQRVARAALRRARALSRRVPALPVPRPGFSDPSLARIQAIATGPRTMRVTETAGTGVPAVGTELVLLNIPDYGRLFAGAPIVGVGWVSGGVFFPLQQVSVEPVTPPQ